VSDRINFSEFDGKNVPEFIRVVDLMFDGFNFIHDLVKVDGLRIGILVAISSLKSVECLEIFQRSPFRGRSSEEIPQRSRFHRIFRSYFYLNYAE